MKPKSILYLLLFYAGFVYPQSKSKVSQNDIGLEITVSGDYDSLEIYSSYFFGELKAMPKIEDSWVSSFAFTDIDSILFDYGIIAYKNGERSQVISEPFRGRYFHKSPRKKKCIKGRVSNYEIFSDFLSETRVLTVYEPAKYDTTKKYPILVCTVGEAINSFVRWIDYEMSPLKLD